MKKCDEERESEKMSNKELKKEKESWLSEMSGLKQKLEDSKKSLLMVSKMQLVICVSDNLLQAQEDHSSRLKSLQDAKNRISDLEKETSRLNEEVEDDLHHKHTN